jgi:hypothetical protein
MQFTTERDRSGAGPWFWLRPELAAGVSTVMFVAVAILQWSVAGPEDAISVLFVLPVALLALSFGLRAGIGSGILGVSLLALWAVPSGEELTVLGWLSRTTPLLLLGVLVGAASDRIRASREAERHSAEVVLLQREAAEINDHVLQQMGAAKWLLEAGRTDDGIEVLATSMDTAQQLVSRMLGSQSVLGRSSVPRSRPNPTPGRPPVARPG